MNQNIYYRVSDNIILLQEMASDQRTGLHGSEPVFEFLLFLELLSIPIVSFVYNEEG